MGWSSPASAGGGFTGSYSSGTITANTPIAFSQTWNNSGVAFTGLTLSITNTASDPTSFLANYSVGGTSQYSVSMSGEVTQKGNLYFATGGNFLMGMQKTDGVGPLIFMVNGGRVGFDGASNFGGVCDTTLGRVMAGVLVASNAAGTGGAIKTIGCTVANLPSAATAGAGTRAFVTDATASTFATTVAGGGSTNVPVYSDGTNWKIG